MQKVNGHQLETRDTESKDPHPALSPECESKCAFVVKYGIFAEKAMAPHSSTLAWKIPWMVEPGRLQSMGSLRVGHD